MKEIKELDNKYLVLKWDDINKLDFDHRQMIQEAVLSILRNRANAGKNEHKYIVLNFDDDISIQQLCNRICVIADDAFMKTQKIKVKDIAVELVNAILKTKEE